VKQNKEKNLQEYIALKDAAAMSSIAYATIKRDIENGKLTAYRVGRKYFIHSDDIKVYSQNRKTLQKIQGYTIKQLMEMIPLSYAFIMELIHSGQLPAVKVGRQYIIPKTEFEAFIRTKKLS